MPGRHAPKSPLSFYLSLAKAVGGVLGVLALIAAIPLVFTGNNNKAPKPIARETARPSLSPSPSLSISPSPTPSIHSPSQITVSVLNGSGRSGLARRTALQVRAAGYVVKDDDIGNAAATKVSTIYFQPAFEAEALALQRRFSGFTQVRPATRTVPANVMLAMIIGADYP